LADKIIKINDLTGKVFALKNSKQSPTAKCGNEVSTLRSIKGRALLFITVVLKA